MKISSLCYYPVKSLKGIEVDSLSLGPTGPIHDREWMIVDESGRFLTQRKYPLLATVEVAVQNDSLHFTAPNVQPIEITRTPSKMEVEVQVWNDTCRAVRMDPAIDLWFRELLEVPCHLVTMHQEFQRAVDSQFSAGAADIVGFADAFPLHITNTASLAMVNSSIEDLVLMNQFRPNIVVDEAPAWDEDSWVELSVKDIPISVVKPRSRCLMINTNQTTGVRGKEPLRHLCKTRKFGKEIMFGMLATHRKPGVLRVGDEVVVVERGAHPSLSSSGSNTI